MDIIKHQSLFEPTKVKGMIGIAGVGALGSALAIQLAKLGNENMILFDDDKVEDHNLPNQILYGPSHVGHHKAEAASYMIQFMTGYKPAWQAVRLTGKPQLGGITHLFVCVDSMAARKEVFEKCVFLNPHIKYFCEGRMNAREGTFHGFDPSILTKAKAYKADCLYSDADVPPDRGTCGNILSLGATASSLACAMTWHFIQFVNGQQKYDMATTDYANCEVHHKGNLAQFKVLQKA